MFPVPFTLRIYKYQTLTPHRVRAVITEKSLFAECIIHVIGLRCRPKLWKNSNCWLFMWKINCLLALKSSTGHPEWILIIIQAEKGTCMSCHVSRCAILTLLLLALKSLNATKKTLLKHVVVLALIVDNVYCPFVWWTLHALVSVFC